MSEQAILDVFGMEIDQIKSAAIRRLVLNTLAVAPEYFWDIPASSTGKYHPAYCVGKGGLVRHTKAAVRIALELFRNESVQAYTDTEKDLIIAALILHDTCKNGFNPRNHYTVTEHPLLVNELFKKIDLDVESAAHAAFISGLIAPHMGQWNSDYKTKKEVLPKPSCRIEIFVHMADYLASRKCIEINFDAPVSS